MDARLTRVESEILELKRDVKAVDDRVDKCLVAINRLDERTRSLTAVTWGGMVVLLIAIIAQKFL